MKRYMNILMLVVATAMLLPAAFVSCAKVEFSDGVQSVKGKEMSRTSVISFDVDWSAYGFESGSHPDCLTVVLNRIQNATLHYVYDIDSEGNLIERPAAETPETPETPEIPENSETPDAPAQTLAEEPETDVPADLPSTDEPEADVEDEETEEQANPFEIYNGLYSMMAVAAHDARDYVIPDIEVFPDSIAYRMRDLVVRVPEMPESERIAFKLLDINPLYPTIRWVNPLYHVKSTSGTHKLISSAEGNDNVVHLVPEQMTRNITFSVDIYVEEGVKVDHILGVISGVPSDAQFISGQVSDKNTSKMPFIMAQENTELQSGRLTFKGDVNVFGLFPSADISFRTGLGILNVIVYASAKDEAGNTYTRMFHDSINMKEQIEEAEIMLQTEDRTGYRLSGTSPVRLDSKTNWALTLKKLLSGSGQGFEIWKENDTEDEEGLNPEI